MLFARTRRGFTFAWGCGSQGQLGVVRALCLTSGRWRQPPASPSVSAPSCMTAICKLCPP